MPRVTISKEIYKQRDLTKWIRGQMSKLEISQEQLGEKLNMTQPGFSYRLKNQKFSYSELRILFNVLQASDMEILEFMR